MNTLQKLFRQLNPRRVVPPCRPSTNCTQPRPIAQLPAAISYLLDCPTETGLPLREAMVVRSAEFWMALGEPRLALREFEALTEVARQNAWAARVHFQAARQTWTA